MAPPLVLEVVDSRLGVEFDEVEATFVLKLGLMCSNDAPPTIRHVVRCLETKLVLEEEEEVVMANSNEDGGKYEFEDFVILCNLIRLLQPQLVMMGILLMLKMV